MKDTKVISAFPACGKSYFFKNNTEYTCLDSDSSLFSWIVKDGEKVRNPEFPANYIKHIQENLGKVDFIFVSSHLQVREALENANIDYVTVYPDKSQKEAWLERMRNRGNDETFLTFQDKNWDDFTSWVDEEPHGSKLYRINGDEYIDTVIKDILSKKSPEISGNFEKNMTTPIR